MKIYYDQVDRFADKTHECKYPKTKKSKECSALQYGTLLTNLQDLDLWPNRPDPSSITSSAHSFADRLLGMKFWYHQSDFEVFDGYSHSKCRISEILKPSVLKLLEHAPSPVLESHLRHLEIQSTKCHLEIAATEAIDKKKLAKDCQMGVECRRCGEYLHHCKSASDGDAEEAPSKVSLRGRHRFATEL